MIRFVDSFPPPGKAISKAVIKISNGLKQSVMKRAMPAPRGEVFFKENLNRGEAFFAERFFRV